VSAEALFGPEPLEPRHDVASFGCGAPALYYSLAAGSVEPGAATERAATGQGRQPIPVIVLARLAVDLTEQGHGLGEQMLVQALARSAEAASLIGVRAVLVHAKDAAARGFYERYGFEPSPTHPLHLLLLMKDIRKTLGV
jgi:GNAT superfamily N-acetyltransferase